MRVKSESQMNKFAANVILLVALLQPIKGIGILKMAGALTNAILRWIDEEVWVFGENGDSTKVRSTEIIDHKPWPVIGHLLRLYYYNSELGSNQPIKVDFHDESTVLGYWINNLPLKLITHGWLADNTNDEGVFAIKTAYVVTGGYNVMTLDWSLIAECIVYPAPAIKTNLVGRALADFLDRLIRVTGLSTADMHLIGHSLGAHVVGAAGKHLESGKVHRVTGLDPAGPGYETIPVIQMEHLNQEDATFVDVIHTAAGTLGYLSHIGHANFYPNSGKDPQPGCNYPINSLFCSHSRAHQLYTDSVYYRHSMFGLECSSWSSFKNHECINNTVVPMGHDAIPSSRGNFYEWTNSHHPFQTYLLEDPSTVNSKH